MKKILMTLLALTLLLSLCACGSEPAAEEPSPAPTQEPAAEEPTVEEPAVVEPAAEEPAAEEPSLLELAESCVGKDVSELYALIGEPSSSDYAPSCLGEGEDGILYYEGFSVYTYREGESERVDTVLAD